MINVKPFAIGLAAATALSLSPMSFGSLPIPVGIVAAQAAATVKIDIFFAPLASHGIWVKHPKYRYVFCPKVDAKWRPYSHGHWIYLKNYGWYFASDEPFAWAVYHYGRWFHQDKIGWCWVPGNAWAGAWVAWRRGNDHVGWSALPPARDGFSINVDISNQEPPQPDWVFVPTKRFLEPRLDVVVEFGDEHPDVFQKTQYVGPVIVQNNIVVNNVIDVNFIEQQTNQKVTVVEPKPVDKPDQAAADASGNTVAVFAPQIVEPKDEAPQQAVEVDQAAQQLGAPSQDASQASSAPSSEQPSSAASSAPVSSSASASSSAPSSAEASSASSSAASSAPASSAAPASSSTSQEPSSSAPAASSTAPSSSEQLSAPSSAAASSSEETTSSEVAPASSSEQPASSLECPEGYEIVDGKCVPLESSAAPTKSTQKASSSAAQ